MTRKLDIVGHRYGRLVVDSFESTRGGSTYWKCLCDCGTQVVVKGSNLKNGNTASCGCLQAQKTSIRSKKSWEPKAQEGHLLVPLTKGRYAKIDCEDYDKVSAHKWCIKDTGYAVSRDGATGKIICMHRVILGLSDDKVDVDHINHDTLDNRKRNLRTCLHFRNCSNRIPVSATPGVHLKRDTGKYAASIMFKKKHIHLGYYSTVEEALRARAEAEKKYFGEYAYKGRK